MKARIVLALASLYLVACAAQSDPQGWDLPVSSTSFGPTDADVQIDSGTTAADSGSPTMVDSGNLVPSEDSGQTNDERSEASLDTGREASLDTDSGSASLDSGNDSEAAQVDSGSTVVDGGSPIVEIDSGPPTIVDAGSVPSQDSGQVTDSGSASLDSGNPVSDPTDSGSPIVDSGSVQADSGASDPFASFTCTMTLDPKTDMGYNDSNGMEDYTITWTMANHQASLQTTLINWHPHTDPASPAVSCTQGNCNVTWTVPDATDSTPGATVRWTFSWVNTYYDVQYGQCVAVGSINVQPSSNSWGTSGLAAGLVCHVPNAPAACPTP